MSPECKSLQKLGRTEHPRICFSLLFHSSIMFASRSSLTWCRGMLYKCSPAKIHPSAEPKSLLLQQCCSTGSMGLLGVVAGQIFANTVLISSFLLPRCFCLCVLMTEMVNSVFKKMFICLAQRSSSSKEGVVGSCCASPTFCLFFA